MRNGGQRATHQEVQDLSGQYIRLNSKKLDEQKAHLFSC